MKKILLSLCAAALSCAANFHAQANTILNDSGTGNLFQTGSAVNLGYDFTVGSTPIMITALGLWDGPNNPFTGSVGDGFANEHVIGLWDNSGNLLAKATMLIGTTDTLMGEFRYSSLLTPINPGPIILSANTTYVLAAAFAGGTDTFRSNNSSTQATFDPAVTSGNGRASTGGFSFPSTNNGPGSFVGPNAIFSLVSNGNGVPEGGATAVLMLGSFALLLGLRRVVRT